jgi:hypothetical protein
MGIPGESNTPLLQDVALDEEHIDFDRSVYLEQHGTISNLRSSRERWVPVLIALMLSLFFGWILVTWWAVLDALEQQLHTDHLLQSELCVWLSALEPTAVLNLLLT